MSLENLARIGKLKQHSATSEDATKLLGELSEFRYAVARLTLALVNSILRHYAIVEDAPLALHYLAATFGAGRKL